MLWFCGGEREREREKGRKAAAAAAAARRMMADLWRRGVCGGLAPLCVCSGFVVERERENGDGRAGDVLG